MIVSTPPERKGATERKQLPDVGVAVAGGWRHAVSFETAYQRADPTTIFRVVQEHRRALSSVGLERLPYKPARGRRWACEDP